jgi:hypothetical protein
MNFITAAPENVLICREDGSRAVLFASVITGPDR